MAETKMPFSYSMGDISSLLEVLGHYVDIGWETSRHCWLDIHVLAPYSAVGKYSLQVVSVCTNLYGYLPVMKATLDGEQVGCT